MIRKIVAAAYRAFWSSFFRLTLGEDWLIRHKKYTKFEQVHHLFDSYFLHYYVRRIGCLVQTRPPDGIILQPYDSLFINREIYLDRVYDKFYNIREDDVVIDVGAHVGVFTLKAARKAKKGRSLPLNRIR
ncbi:MAG: hypothetical protein QXH44_09660 [Pyrobaculum sp.]